MWSDTTTTEEEEEEARIELEEARTELEAARKEMKNAIVVERELLALPSPADEGLVELPSDDCDDGGGALRAPKALRNAGGGGVRKHFRAQGVIIHMM